MVICIFLRALWLNCAYILVRFKKSYILVRFEKYLTPTYLLKLMTPRAERGDMAQHGQLDQFKFVELYKMV